MILGLAFDTRIYICLLVDEQGGSVEIKFNIESWSALAPGINSQADWAMWLNAPTPLNEPFEKPEIKGVPPLLRRRFNLVGRCAMGAILNLLQTDDGIPCVFASRHGDTATTLALLENMGKSESMSPTSFSLAVHNAVSGLYTIACKNTQPVTAIAATEGLTINALFETIGQCQNAERILCIIYDAPLPDLYQNYCPSEPFPYAIAMIINKSQGEPYQIHSTGEDQAFAAQNPVNAGGLALLPLLTGRSTSIEFNYQANPYKITRLKANAVDQT